MRQSRWFLYFLKRSIRERIGRFALAAAAVFLGASIVSALVTLSAGVRERIGAELTSYGANMIVTDASGGTIDWADAERVQRYSDDIRNASLRIFGTVAVSGRWVEVIGMEPSGMAAYRVSGTAPAAADEAMIGTDISTILGIKTGDELLFDGGRRLAVRGIFESGSDEDKAVVMPLRTAADLLGIEGAHAVLLNADAGRLNALEAAIRGAFPSLAVKTVRQVARAEEALLSKMQTLMLVVTAVVLFSSVIALGSTMGANVIERTGEIGVLKALGATRQDIAKFFLSEAALSGFFGAFAGWLCGVATAEIVSRAAFGSYIPVTLNGLLAALAVGLPLGVLATLLPVRSAMRMVPAEILRGE